MPALANVLLTVVLSVQPAPVTPAPVQASPWTDDRLITRFFQNLGRDFSHVASADSAGLLIAGATIAAAAHHKDAAASAWAVRRGASRAETVGDVLGGRQVQAGGALALWIIGKAARNAQMTHIGSDLIRAHVVSSLITISVKGVSNRERPSGKRYSFPSGHTSAAFATATVVQRHYGWKAGSVAYGLAGFVGWSRVRGNNHWLSDVVMGSAVGIVAGRAATWGHASAWMVVPVKTSGGVAVLVTRRPTVPARVNSTANRD